MPYMVEIIIIFFFSVGKQNTYWYENISKKEKISCKNEQLYLNHLPALLRRVNRQAGI
jgi:hypothetical protein